VRIGIKLRNIEPNIDELVLHGFSPRDRYRIGEVVEQELSRLFAEQDLPSSLADGGKIDHLDGGAFEAAQGSRPETIGLQVAQAVYRGLKSD
jgi:hypothetical protein